MAKGLHPRIELADISQAAPYLEMGVKHFCIGWDVRILHQWWQVNGKGMRDMLEKASGEPVKVAAKEPVASY